MKEDEDCRNVSNKFNWVALAQQSHLATDWSRIARSGTVVLKEASARLTLGERVAIILYFNINCDRWKIYKIFSCKYLILQVIN